MGRIGVSLAAWLILGFPIASRAQSLALTFDDGLDPREQPQSASWNKAILSALAKEKIQSLLFAAGKRVDSEEGLALVKDWGMSGHAVANHTYSHLNFNSAQTTLEGFVTDVERDEALLKDLPGWTRRLRFPYLKEGDTAAKRDDFRRWLVHHRYRSGAVSIDTSDWYYNNRYLSWKAAHPGDDPSRFRSAYLAHLWGRAFTTTAYRRDSFIGASNTFCCSTPTPSTRHFCPTSSRCSDRRDGRSSVPMRRTTTRFMG